MSLLKADFIHLENALKTSCYIMLKYDHDKIVNQVLFINKSIISIKRKKFTPRQQETYSFGYISKVVSQVNSSSCIT